MSDFLGSVWWLIVSIGVLVTFHEFGHYWVARRFGVKVLRFSVGFGKPLWMRRGKDGTEYVIAAIPLGGYVKMLDENTLGESTLADSPPSARAVPATELDQAFNRQSVWRRIAIVSAGPIANLLLCVALLWTMFVIGRPDYAPVVGDADGIAADSGLRRGDTLLAVGGRETPTWSEALYVLITAALDRADTPVQVRTADGSFATRELRLSQLPASLDERRTMAAIGLVPRHQLIPAVIGRVLADGPAWGVLAEGDRITAIDGISVSAWTDLAPLIQKLGARGEAAMVEVERDGDRLALELKPKRGADATTARPYWILGIENARAAVPAKDAVLRYGPLRAIPAAVNETAFQAGELLTMLGRAFRGRIAVENTVSGPITMARAANAYANQGLAWYLNLLALLSLSLAILNFLPIPVLDGGHLLYYLIELVKGSPLSDRAMAVGQYVGLALIAGLMGLAFYNDILNNFLR